VRRKLKRLTPIQILVIGYVIVVLVSAFLLTLPIASKQRIARPFIDAVFTTSSAISTTGLTVVDIGSFYSIFGQIIILIVFQIGGLGYMTFFVFLAYVLNSRLSLANRTVARESLSGPTFGNIFSFFKSVVVFTLFFELIGAFILSIYWMREYSVLFSIYLGIFHSISAFCTAGFSIFSNNLMAYKNSVIINIIIPIICLAGGIGFFVLYDLYNWIKQPLKYKQSGRLTIHSKLALSVTAIVISFGSLVVFVTEKSLQPLPFIDHFFASLFQCIAASTTTGFNTINIEVLGYTPLFILILLMFIGASPGSTGGGIKTTTLGTISKFLWNHLIGKKDVDVFHRRIPYETINRAFSIFAWFVFVVVIDTLILTFTEKASFHRLLFEIVSALGNAGLSTGITSNLTGIGKLLLSITMFIGRVGPLTIGFSLIGKAKPTYYKYPEGNILVG
jgi:trk system potassium uptake protein TrkH